MVAGKYFSPSESLTYLLELLTSISGGAGAVWWQAGQTNTTAGAQNAVGLLFFTIIFIGFWSMLQVHSSLTLCSFCMWLCILGLRVQRQGLPQILNPKTVLSGFHPLLRGGIVLCSFCMIWGLQFHQQLPTQEISHSYQ